MKIDPPYYTLIKHRSNQNALTKFFWGENPCNRIIFFRKKIEISYHVERYHTNIPHCIWGPAKIKSLKLKELFISGESLTIDEWIYELEIRLGIR